MRNAFSAYVNALRRALTETPCSVRSDRSTCASIKFEKESKGGRSEAGRMSGGNWATPSVVGYSRPSIHDRRVAGGNRV